MIRFEFTDNYVHTCRDCKKNASCPFTKGSTDVNHLPCIEAVFEPRRPKVTNAHSDYRNLRKQLSNMMCIIESSKNELRREDLLPNSLKTPVLAKKHTFTEYCNFYDALKHYYNFLIENEKHKDDEYFVDQMIKTVIRLEDNGKINVNTFNKELKVWFKNGS